MLDFIAIPFGYVMRYIYEVCGSYGLSIVLFTLLTQLLMLPLTWKQKKGMMDVQRIQPKMNELQKRYANNREKYSQELQKLYDEEGVSPLSGCLPMLLTLPIMMGLYYVVSQPLTFFMGLSADQVTALAGALGIAAGNPYTQEVAIAGEMFAKFDQIKHLAPNLMKVDFNFLGLNLALTPSFKKISVLWAIPFISGGTAFLQSWVMRKMQQRQGVVVQPGAGAQNAMMNIMMPAMSVYFGFILPAGLGIYWISRNVFSSLQELVLTPYFIKKSREKEAQLIDLKAQKESSKKAHAPNLGNQPKKTTAQDSIIEAEVIDVVETKSEDTNE